MSSWSARSSRSSSFSGREQPGAGGGQLDREGEAVEAATDRVDGLVGCDLAPDGLCPLDEEVHGVGRRERVERVLALAGDPKRASARHENAQPSRAREEAAHGGCSVQQVLEVVQEQQDALSLQEVAQAVPSAEGLGDLRLDQLRIGDRRERNPEHTVAERADELRGDLEGEAGLPGAARAGHGHLSRAVPEEREHVRQLALPAEERACGQRKVRCVEGSKRRERPVAQLEQALGTTQVLQPMLAEVVQLDVLSEKRARRGRDDDLAAVPTRGDASAAVHVHADVALRCHPRLARVDAHPYAHGSVRQPAPRLERRRRGVRGRTEDDEESVSLRVDLDSAVVAERFA